MQPLPCAMEVADRDGSLAIPLEPPRHDCSVVSLNPSLDHLTAGKDAADGPPVSVNSNEAQAREETEEEAAAGSLASDESVALLPSLAHASSHAPLAAQSPVRCTREDACDRALADYSGTAAQRVTHPAAPPAPSSQPSWQLLGKVTGWIAMRG